MPVADGGDGTLDAARRGRVRRGSRCGRRGPTGEPVDTAFAVARRRRGRRDGRRLRPALLPADRLAALSASSYGTGEVVRAALDAGCRDGRARASAAVRAPTAAPGCCRRSAPGSSTPTGRSCRRGGAALAGWTGSTCPGCTRGSRETRVVVASDVDNPLLGPNGAAAVYGPQKGASPADVGVLDAALARWADVVDAAVRPPADRAGRCETGREPAPRAGWASPPWPCSTRELRAGDRAHARPGRLRRPPGRRRLVVTGEGSLDEQTLQRQGPGRAWPPPPGRPGFPVVTVSRPDGCSPPDQLRGGGIQQAYALTDIEPDVRPLHRRGGPAAAGARASELARDWLTSWRTTR